MLTFNRKELLTAVRNCSKIIPKKVTAPILSCVQIEYGKVTATNGDTWISIEVEGLSNQSSAKLATPAKGLAELLSSLSADTVDVCPKQGTVGGIRVDNLTDELDSEETPVATSFYEGAEVTTHVVSAESLAKVLDQALFVLSGDASVISGILCISGQNVVATDSFRMSVSSLGQTPFDVLVPSEPLKVLNGLLKSGLVTIKTDGAIVVFEASGQFSVTVPTVEAEYVRFEDVLPSNESASIIEVRDRKEMLSKLKVLKHGLDGKLNLVSIHPDGQISNDKDSVPAPFTWTNGDHVFTCNYDYLVQALDSVTDDSLNIEDHGHFVLLAGGGSYKHLLCGVEAA